MREEPYDLVVIGAGSGGLTAAGFAAQIGARVALVERDRVGGDCTWSGCVPSKALLKVAKVAHEARWGRQYGVLSDATRVDIAQVRTYIRRAIAEIYAHETPEQLARKGVEVVLGAAHFLDAHTIRAGEQTLRARHVLITTGAHPRNPAIPGLDTVPYLTHTKIFEHDRLPGQLAIIGAGPVGVELAQAYRRLGAEVALIGPRLLPREDAEVAQVISSVFADEGVCLVADRARAARALDDGRIVVTTGGGEVVCDTLLVAAGRAPNVAGLDLERAGVTYSARGIAVDAHMRTSVPHIYAAGDVVGGPQYTHLAAWQAFYATRNALVPGGSAARDDIIPRVTFTDPEVAHVGLTEAEARARHGDGVVVTRMDLERFDRAVCENDLHGFLKVMHRRGGAILGATMVAARAGEAITEFALAIRHGLPLSALTDALHPYPTYTTGVMQLAADATADALLSNPAGRLALRAARWLNDHSGI